MCMYALSVSTMEPKNVKEAMTDPAWMDSMQEELLQFKRLDSRLIVRWYRQEEGINFEESFALVAKMEAINADYAGSKDTFKSTSGGAQFIANEKSWDCQVGIGGGGDNRLRLGCLVAAGVGREWVIIARTFRVILFSIHSDEWKSFQSQHQIALRIRRCRYNLTPAESKFNTPMLDHQNKHIMKAQVHVSKSSAISDEQALPRRKHYCQNDKSIKW
nr:retrovirus-related Pol polyprotein from transposon TNT 1-94 [Tanacetum cinerariifolium]